MRKLREKKRRFELHKSYLAMRELHKKNKLRKFRKNSGDSKEVVSFDSSSNTLIAPPHFIINSSVQYNYHKEIDEYFGFINAIRNYKRTDLCIDLTNVRRMVSNAALLFKAELSRLIEVSGVKVKAVAPTRLRINQVLKQTGMEDLLGLTIDCPLDREDVVHWRVAEGPRSTVDPDALCGIMDDIEAVTGMASHPIYQGIIESMSNCVEHAYKSHPEVNKPMPNNPGWWVFQQVKDKILSVVVCDLGIGVRRSLPMTLASEDGLLKKLMYLSRRAKGRDNRALLAAMEYGRTSTKEIERGKGMRNAHRVVDDLGVGVFTAMSNSGAYIYSKPNRRMKGKRKTVKLRHSIQGTILGWRLPLNPEDNPSPSHD